MDGDQGGLPVAAPAIICKKHRRTYQEKTN
jgi:hypothetical protein